MDVIENSANDITYDVYGPFTDGLSERDFDGKKRCIYRGLVSPGKVHETLQNYDAVLLPTTWKGEGYPGIIIEAFQAGMPVITTNWRSIPELVDESCGMLVPIEDPTALAQAVERISSDSKFYSKLCQAAGKRGLQFDSAHWNEEFVGMCCSLQLPRHLPKNRGTL